MKEGRRIIIKLREVKPWTFTSRITALMSPKVLMVATNRQAARTEA